MPKFNVFHCSIFYLFIAWKVSVFGVFLVRIFPHSDWIRRDTEYLFLFSLNAGKHRPRKLRIQKLFTHWTSHPNMKIGYCFPCYHLITIFRSKMAIIPQVSIWWHCRKKSDSEELHISFEVQDVLEKYTLQADQIPSKILEADFHKFYFVHSCSNSKCWLRNGQISAANHTGRIQ